MTTETRPVTEQELEQSPGPRVSHFDGETITWVEEDGETFATVHGMQLVIWWEEASAWTFQVQRGGDVLEAISHAPSSRDAELSALMWALGYHTGLRATSTIAGNSERSGSAQRPDSSPSPANADSSHSGPPLSGPESGDLGTPSLSGLMIRQAGSPTPVSAGETVGNTTPPMRSGVRRKGRRTKHTGSCPSDTNPSGGAGD